MLTIETKKEKDGLWIMLKGRLDSQTAPYLEKEVSEQLEEVTRITFDVKQLEFISSAGLRIIIKAYNSVKKYDGIIIIRGANEEVKDVFDITGFTEKLKME